MSDKDMVKISFYRDKDYQSIRFNGHSLIGEQIKNVEPDDINNRINRIWHVPVEAYIKAAGTCVWEWDEDYKCWNTNCEKAFLIVNENNKLIEKKIKPKDCYNHCPNCGRCISENKPKEPK